MGLVLMRGDLGMSLVLMQGDMGMSLVLMSNVLYGYLSAVSL